MRVYGVYYKILSRILIFCSLKEAEVTFRFYLIIRGEQGIN